MPEYLAPGVYVEETSFRSKSIEGVSTTTTGFIGPCRYGPVDLVPDILTSLGDFERTYGDDQLMQFADAADTHNYLWHAARAFFEEGGRRLYLSRIFRPDTDDTTVLYERPAGDAASDYRSRRKAVRLSRRPCTRMVRDAPRPGSVGNVATVIEVRARFPRQFGNLKVRFTLRAGRNILAVGSDGIPTLSGSLQENDIVWIGDVILPISSPPGDGEFYRAEKDPASGDWRFRDSSGTLSAPGIAALIPGANLGAGHAVHIVTLTVTVYNARDEDIGAWADLPIDPGHIRSGLRDSLFDYFAIEPSSALRARQLPIVLSEGGDIETGLDVLTALFGDQLDDVQTIGSPGAEDTPGELLLKGIFVETTLQGGNDGRRPESTEYEGRDDPAKLFKTGLKQFEDIEDISIVAAPGSTQSYASRVVNSRAIMGLLINHAQRMRYRIAVLDAGDALAISEVRDLRAKFDSSYAALYYPWIRVMDPVTRSEIHLPPSGFVSGIYARNDINRAVFKAPANEVVNLALGFEVMLNKAQQEVLNPEGINCFRFFEGRGMLLWGARTISSDSEWKYVNLRRYFAYLERSIDKGTQWAVFEPNGERLWASVRRTVEDFLLNEWQNGALLGEKPEKAYFVKCDRGTMGQYDLDNGRLVCLVGVAPLRPAEFVIFRVGQWTADRKI
jgi:phage tail sheath protein FI